MYFFIQRCEEKSTFNSWMSCTARKIQTLCCLSDLSLAIHNTNSTVDTHWSAHQHNSRRRPGGPGRWNIQTQLLEPAGAGGSALQVEGRGQNHGTRGFYQAAGVDGQREGRTHSTFSVNVQLFAPNDGGVVKAVGHFAVVRPCTAPSHRQQQHGSFRKLVHHVDAVLVVQQHFVEEPLVPGVGAFGCLTVEPQADHSVVLSNVVVVAHRHSSTNWDWRTVYSNIQTNNCIYYRWTEVLVSKRKATRNCKNKTVQYTAWPVETAKNVCNKTLKMAVLKYGKEL